MSDFSKIQNQAKKEWQELHNSKDPIIYLGMGSCGIASGANTAYETLMKKLKEKSIKAHIIKVGCIGPCYLEPIIDIQKTESPRISYNNINEFKINKLIDEYVLGDDPQKPMSMGHLDESRETYNEIESFWNAPMLKQQVRLVLRNCGIIDPEKLSHYIARGGFEGLINAFEKGAEGVIEEIKIAGLRGRGGAGFPVSMKWELCRNAKGNPKYMICNADEGDPGAFMNRSLMEGDPYALLEGLIIASYAIGANTAFIYTRAEYPLAITRLKTAIHQLHEHNLLGKNILDSGFDLEIKVKEGAGAFVCGEETALIASIEGQRGMPRPKPPFPATSGLYGKPTTINNVETIATVPNILREGGKWYNQFGSEKSKGTKTFALVGKVRRTGLIEVPLGITLREIIYDIGGGSQKKFKAVQTGGPSGGCLSEEHLDLKVDYENLAKAGSIMGSGGLIVMDEHTCMVDVAKYFLNFTSQESCGKCVPCRVGTQKMVTILNNITKGKAKPEDLELLEDLSDTIKQGSLCGLGQTAPNPVLTTLKLFKDEYKAHVEDKRCPAAVCRELVEYRVVKEKCTGCQRCVNVCPTKAITGPRSEPHNLDQSKCIKCRACYEICRFDAIAGDAIVIE